MRKFNLLKDYPQPKKPRIVGPNLRTISNRIIANYRSKELYDGDRNFGYGGFKYDGRWKPIAKKICEEYNLNEKSSLLQLGCEKGFLLHDLKELYPEMKIRGIDMSTYAIENAMDSIKDCISTDIYTKLNFKDNEFDFIIAIGVVYPLNLMDAITCLKEIQRVAKGNSFINLASYTNQENYWLFKNWTLIGTLILLETEWIEVMRHANYTGDYNFVNAESLNLVSEKKIS